MWARCFYNALTSDKGKGVLREWTNPAGENGYGGQSMSVKWRITTCRGGSVRTWSRGTTTTNKKISTPARGNMRLSYAQKERQFRAECAQEEIIMNKALKTMLCAAAISGAFLVGNMHGEQSVLQNQIIYEIIWKSEFILC